ncbi:MAG: hypothetical protein UT63_C0058G0015 [Candidatus Gottesmanbacteria bacterium GW2011_GWC2_39_8]|uniref:Uncharacterized protein n=1 Tax=Candidatus Gottesmanbacteria bacterium GW2011_GWC2_39_8 TaxID=1618450 RepID=A0A0G0PUN8_9BACT|nr:MAG: hypothetical protein UT63_C0058G0015 [Candidatus Gottesmanbacteria bacterium GW2011_GWC2_39_8]
MKAIKDTLIGNSEKRTRRGARRPETRVVFKFRSTAGSQLDEKALGKFEKDGGLIVYRDRKSDNYFAIGLQTGHMHLSSQRGYILNIDHFDPREGLQRHYIHEFPPEIQLDVVPKNGTLDTLSESNGHKYFVRRGYDFLGRLKADSYDNGTDKDKALADYRKVELQRFGHLTEDFLPRQIDVDATIKALVRQVRAGNFGRPRLVKAQKERKRNR